MQSSPYGRRAALVNRITTSNRQLRSPREANASIHASGLRMMYIHAVRTLSMNTPTSIATQNGNGLLVNCSPGGEIRVAAPPHPQDQAVPDLLNTTYA